MTFLDDDYARHLLKNLTADHGSTTKIAHKIGVSACLISLMKTGKRRINATVARELGLEPVTGFVMLSKSQPKET